MDEHQAKKRRTLGRAFVLQLILVMIIVKVRADGGSGREVTFECFPSQAEHTNIRGGERWEWPFIYNGLVKVNEVGYDDNCKSHGRQRT